jgi:hypothetical protein
VLTSGFCLRGGRLLAFGALALGEEAGGAVSARRSSSGGGECWRPGGGEMRDGGGDSRLGKVALAATGLLRGGLSTLLMMGAGLLEIGLLAADVELAADGELEGAGAVGRLRRDSMSSCSRVSAARDDTGSRRTSELGGRVESGMRGPPSSLFRR